MDIISTVSIFLKAISMNTTMVGVMIATSVFMGLIGLIGFIWGLRNGQFDDEKKMMQGVLFDTTEDLQNAAKSDAKKQDKQQPKKGVKDE